MTMYSFKVWDENNTLILDLIPVKIGEEKNGNIAPENGFYDKVSNTFKCAEGLDYIEPQNIKEIEDSGIIENSLYSAIINKNGATLTLKSGKISVNANNQNAIYNEVGGTVNIDGGTALNKVPINNKGTFNMNGGSIRTTDTGISNTGTVNINGGSVSTEVGVSSYSGTVNVNGGTILGGSIGISNEGSAVLNVYDGYIMSYTRGMGVIHNDSTANIYEGKIIRLNGDGQAVYNDGTLNIEGAEIVSESVGIKNSWSGKTKINGENVSIKATKDGIYNDGDANSEIKVEKGNIISENNYGICNGSSGKLIIGIKDGQVFDNAVNIISNQNSSIYNVGELYFYDGTIKGKYMAIYGNVTGIEENTEISITSEEGSEVAKLISGSPLAQVGSSTYNTLKESVAACVNLEDTITILRNFVVTENDIIEISNAQNITINTNGKAGTSYSTSNLIKNTGTLKLTGNGSFNSKSYGLIENTGYLEIGEVTLNVSVEHFNEKNLVTNSGTLKLTQGTINMDAPKIRGIYNTGEGAVEVTGGNIVSTKYNTYGIFNNGTKIKNESGEAAVTINGGTINVSNTGINNSGTGMIRILACNINNSDNAVYNDNAGTIIMEGGTIDTGDNSIYNRSTGSVEIRRGDITGQVVNNANGTVTISGDTSGENKTEITTSNSYAVCNNGSGITAILGGKIKATKQDCIFNQSNGTIILGNSEDELIASDLKPYIIAEGNNKYGVKINNTSTGKFKFYDGKIEATEGYTMNTSPTEKVEGYEVHYYTNADNGGYEITSGMQIAVLKQGTVARVESSGEIYGTLQRAFEHIGDVEGGDTVTLLKDISIGQSDASVIVEAGKSVILDLNGHIVQAANTNTLINNGSLKILDNTEGKAGVLKNTVTTIVKNEENAILELISGKISLTSSDVANKCAIENSGTINLNGLTINNTGGRNNAINNNPTGTVNVISGEIKIYTDYDKSPKCIYNSGEVNVTGGSMNGYISIKNIDSGIANIQSATLVGGLINTDSGKITIGDYASVRGITNEATYDAESGTGKVTINGGTVTGEITNRAMLEINGGTINSTTTAIINTGKLEINGGNIIDTYNGGNRSAVDNNSNGEINITKCNIESATYGIRNNSSSAKITLGTKLGEITNEIQIKSTIFAGIYNKANGTVNYYDGVIKGVKGSFIGSITEIKDGKQIEITQEVSGTSTLEVSKLVAEDNVAQVNGIGYLSLEGAINACGSEQTTIKILKDFVMTNEDVVVTSKNIILDLDGHTITTYANSIVITNNGTLKITGNGTINSKGQGIIENTGKCLAVIIKEFAAYEIL